MDPTSSSPTEPTPETPEAVQTPASIETPPVLTPEFTIDETPTVVPVSPFVSAGEPTADTSIDPGHSLGIASLILSIVGIHIVGLILGIIALNKSKKSGHNNPLALAGIIVGGVGLLFVFAIVALTIPVFLALA